MAKDPAFLFYSKDFLTGTMTMSFEDRGRYITILSLMHQQGRMTEETINFLVGEISPRLKEKFSVDEKGLWFNDRLEIEVEKRKKFTESRRSNLKKKNSHMDSHMNAHMNDHMSTNNESHMDAHMVNAIVNANSIENSVKDKGVKGEKELNQLEIQKTIEYIHYTIQVDLTEKKVKDLWKGFLIASEGDTHLNWIDKITHFRNWIKKQKHETVKRIDTARPGTKLSAI